MSSQINYMLTNFADHSAHSSHDNINRYLAGDQIIPRLVWVRLKQVVAETQRAICQVKHDLLSDYLRQPLKTPTVKMLLA